MWLRNGDHAVLVSPQGGSILQWQWREHFILGPTRMVRVGDKLKARGETHWCYPNFGTIREPKYASSQPQHGLLRTSVLDIADCSDSKVELLPLHRGLSWSTTHNPKVEVELVAIGPSSVELRACLRVSNTNDGRTPLQPQPILPAIHPYFAVPPGGLSLIVDNKPIRGEDVPSNDHPTEDMIIERCGLPICVYLHGIGRVELVTATDCSHVVIWSDNSSAYVCVEPVFGRPGSYGTPQGRWLGPGENAQCATTFRFDPA